MEAFQVAPRAVRDIHDIYDYIERQSPQNARLVVSRIYSASQDIAATPKLGHPVSELKTNIRIFEVGGFYLIYDPGTRPLTILRVVRVTRNLNRIRLI